MSARPSIPLELRPTLFTRPRSQPAPCASSQRCYRPPARVYCLRSVSSQKRSISRQRLHDYAVSIGASSTFDRNSQQRHSQPSRALLTLSETGHSSELSFEALAAVSRCPWSDCGDGANARPQTAPRPTMSSLELPSTTRQDRSALSRWRRAIFWG